MPSATLNPDHRSLIKKVLVESGNQKIITATVARLYVAYPDPNEWTYTGIMGGLALVWTPKSFYFRIVDLKEARGVIWEQELYRDFDYRQERTFFHTFELDECLAGFSFADDQEAGIFYKKVTNPEEPKKKKKSKSKGSGFFGSKKTKVDKDMIGLPSNFQHVASIRYDPKTGFDAHNVDFEFQAMMEKVGITQEQMDKAGITKEQIQNDAEFVTQFVANYKKDQGAKKPAAPASRAPPRTQPPPPPASRRQPPPPPASRMSRIAPASNASAPPALPVRESPAPAREPALPAREPALPARESAPPLPVREPVASPPSPEPAQPHSAPPPPTPPRSNQSSGAPPPPPRPY
ncbi:hypothetical protein BGX34_009595, partial [Mortierella sp. NVP85]